jgi:predicted nucleic acid-binding Zn ribbon protein
VRPEDPVPCDWDVPDAASEVDPAGLDPTGLGLARALAGDLAARARAEPGRRLSRAALAGRAEAAGLPLAPGVETSAPTSRPGTRYRPPPHAGSRVGGLASSDPFTGPGADPADPRALGSELDRVLEGVGGRARAAVHALFAQWPDLVGTDVAAHSRPTGFVDGMLQVSADSSAWATQLRLLGPTICATLDQRLGAGTVAGIVVSGPARPSWRHGAFGLRDARGPRDTYG